MEIYSDEWIGSYRHCWLIEEHDFRSPQKKLVIYINPPYAEHGNRSVFAGEVGSAHKTSVANKSKVYNEFSIEKYIELSDR